MPSSPARNMRPRRATGFTLIELMITVAIIAVIAAVALPAYNGSVRKSRRADAVSALTALQQSQERWRANNAAYTATMTSLNAPSVSPGGLYGVSIDAADASGYLITAQAVSGSSQAADTPCATMRLQLVLGNIFYGGCNGCAVPVSPATVTDPGRCWNR